MSTVPALDARAVERPPWIDSGHIPSLDGLRAIAIAMVVASHVTPSILGRSHRGLGILIGDLGVDVFFVISGFLITLLLMREEAREGRISLRGFYRRRALRIFPAYAVYLGFAWILAHVMADPIPAWKWIAALTYLSNLTPDAFGSPTHAYSIVHSWSLAVEEHFYLIWPCVFLAAGARSSVRFLIGAALIAPLCRYFLETTLPRGFIPAFWTPARMDVIADGCLLAYLITSPAHAGWIGAVTKFPGVIVLGSVSAIVMSKLVVAQSWRYAISLDRSVTTLAICGIVLACVTGVRSSIGWLLNSRPLIFVGILSYSLYLWQQPFLNPDGTAWICRWPQNLMLTLMCALASRFLIERPFLRWKDRLGRVEHG